MTRSAIAVALLLALLPVGDIAAQTTGGDPLTPVGSTQFGPEAGPSTVSRILSGVAGAAIGAGLGFFASQVVQGDWDESGGSEALNRTLWAAVGGSVGLGVGLRYPVLSGQGIGVNGPRLPTGRDHIGLADLEGRGFDNAHQVVSTLRPEWLQIRGNRSLAAAIDPVVAEGTGAGMTITGSTPLIDESATIQVYVNNVRIGGTDALNSVDAHAILDVYYFDAAKATARWGGSNPHGAILIIT